MKRYLKYIDSEIFRNWFEEDHTRFDISDMVNLILKGRADIREKLFDLKALRENCDENSEEIRAYISEEIDEYIRNYERAIELMSNPAHDTVFMHESGYYNGDSFDGTDRCYASPFKTFESVLEYISEAVREDELDDDCLSWNVVTRYDVKDGQYEVTAEYVIGHNGVVWFAFTEDKLYFNGLNLPTPFQCGDIVTIDVRPFHPLTHGVVIWKTNLAGNREDCCSPGVLYKTEDGISVRALKHLFNFRGIFSPLNRVEIFNGALPEDESILGKVSEYIKTHDNGAEAIEILDMKYSEKKFAEELEKLIGSETPIYF